MNTPPPDNWVYSGSFPDNNWVYPGQPPLPQELALDIRPRWRRRKWTGAACGATIGVIFGGVFAAVGSCLLDYGDYARPACLFSAIIGILFGGIIGYVECTLHHQRTSWDVTTYVGCIFASLLSAILLVGVFGFGFGRFTIWWTIGVVCAAPIFGFLVGRLCDHSFTLAQQHAWRGMWFFMALGLAECWLPAYLALRNADPTPNEVGPDAVKSVLDDWSRDPELKKAKLQKVSLGPPVHRVYRGKLEAAVEGRVVGFDMEVYVRHNKIDARWSRRP